MLLVFMLFLCRSINLWFFYLTVKYHKFVYIGFCLVNSKQTFLQENCVVFGKVKTSQDGKVIKGRVVFVPIEKWLSIFK